MVAVVTVETSTPVNGLKLNLETVPPQKSSLYPYFLCDPILNLRDHVVSFLSEMYLKAFNFCIQNTHSFTAGGFILPFVLVWNVAHRKLNGQFLQKLLILST